MLYDIYDISFIIYGIITKRWSYTHMNHTYDMMSLSWYTSLPKFGNGICNGSFEIPDF